MSNLKIARQALEAELAHAKEGIAYYTARAESLTQALATLLATEIPAQDKKQTAASGKKARATKNPPSAKSSKAGGDLPNTGSAFWLQFLSEEPKSGVDLVNAAVASLEFEPSADQVKKLKQRIFPVLESLLKANKVKDSGTGRDRRFFLASSGNKQTAIAAKGRGGRTNSENASLH